MPAEIRSSDIWASDAAGNSNNQPTTPKNTAPQNGSWFDKVGHVWDSGVHLTGGAIYGANHWLTSIPYLGSVASTTEHGVGLGASLALDGIFGPIGQLDAALIRPLARGISAFTQVTENASDPNVTGGPGVDGFKYLLNPQSWTHAWENSDTLGPGQALYVGAFHPQGVTFDNGGDNAMFTNDWKARLFSGTWDAIVDLGFDPLNVAGKAAKGAYVASNTVKPGEAGNIMKILDGTMDAADATRREARLSNRANQIITKYTNGSASEIIRHPFFKRASNGGTWAYLMEQANRATDLPEVERLAMKRNVVGAMLGDEGSVSALRAQHATLAAELDQLQQPPLTVENFGKWNFDDQGKMVWDSANPIEQTPFENAQADAIKATLGRLSKVVDVQEGIGPGSSRALVGTTPFTGAKQAALRTGIVLGGFGVRPIRVVSAQFRNRLPGYINLKDSSQGYIDFQNYLNQSIWLAKEKRAELLQRYLAEPTLEGRRDVVLRAESAVNKSIATKYGVPTISNVAVQLGRRRSDNVLGIMKRRQYSAAPDAQHAMIFDPETGEYTAWDRPVIGPQLEDALPVADPRQLEKAYRWAASKRWVDKIPLVDTPAFDWLEDTVKSGIHFILNGITTVWKHATLINPGYPLRILWDAALRPNVAVGSFNYLMQFPNVMRSLAKRSRAEGETFSDKFAKEFLNGLGIPEEDHHGIINAVVAKNGGAADLANESGNYMLGNMLGNGQWSTIQANDKAWEPAYIRAVNQIRHSPTAMAVVRGLRDGDLARFVRTNKASRREWDDMSGMHGDMEMWLARVQAHVDHYLPGQEHKLWVAGSAHTSALTEGKATVRKTKTEPTQRTTPAIDKELGPTEKDKAQATLEATGFRGRAVTREQTKEWFGDGSGMPVHGEGFNPVNTSDPSARFLARLKQGRNWYYRTVAETPENILARFPLYGVVYEQELRSILAMMGEDMSRGTDGLKAALNPNLKTTFKAAKDRATGKELKNRLAAVTTENLGIARRTADAVARRTVADSMYDASRTSNWAGTFRHVAPFWSAWEDTMRKYTRLFWQNPGSAGQVGLAWTSPDRNNLLRDDNGNFIDADGNYYDAETGRKLDQNNPVDAHQIGRRRLIALPMNLLPQGMRDTLENTFGVEWENVDKDSINSIFQGEPYWAPGTGPLVQAAVNKLVLDQFPEAEKNPIIQWVLPYGTSDSTLDQFIPARLRRFRSALWMNDKTYDEALKNILAFETARWQQGLRPDRPLAAEFRQKARMYVLMNAATNYFAPFTFKADQEGQFYLDQMHVYQNRYTQDPNIRKQYVQQYGDALGKAKFEQDHPDWQQKFYQDFPGWFAMTASLTANETGIRATIKARNEAEKLLPWIQDRPEYGWAVVGPANIMAQADDQQFSQAALNKERQWGFRNNQSPQDAVNAALENQGWVQYQQATTLRNLKLQEMGLTSINDPRAKNIREIFKTYRETLAKNNHAWAVDYGQWSTEKALDVMDFLNEIMAKRPDFAQRSDMKVLLKYQIGRTQIMGALAQRKSHGINTKANADLKRIWDGFTSSLVNSDIGFEQLWNRALQHDNLDMTPEGQRTADPAEGDEQ